MTVCLGVFKEDIKDDFPHHLLFSLTANIRATAMTPTPATRSTATTPNPWATSETPIPFERPKSRTIGIQTESKRDQCCKKHRRISRPQSRIEQKSDRIPQMLTVERIWTPYLGKKYPLIKNVLSVTETNHISFEKVVK